MQKLEIGDSGEVEDKDECCKFKEDESSKDEEEDKNDEDSKVDKGKG